MKKYFQDRKMQLYALRVLVKTHLKIIVGVMKKYFQDRKMQLYALRVLVKTHLKIIVGVLAGVALAVWGGYELIKWAVG